MAAMELDTPPAIEATNLTYRYGGGSTIHTRALSEAKLDDVSLSFAPGSRILVAGANGAGKSTLMSILGGKKMISNADACKVLGRPTFHDTTLDKQRMYCGDWWRTNFFHNLSAAELLGDRLNTPRVQELIDLLQVDISWRINAISDGQRRRIQLLEVLAESKDVYVLDEITTDLDVYAREELLGFLRRESERGATIVYATHIFDQLAEWATHFVFLSHAKIVRACSMEDFTEYHAAVAAKARVPLYALVKEWIFREYEPMSAPMSVTPWPARSTPVLEMRNMSYTYGKGATPSLPR
jgi:CCR4-NOT complex subunit CAF16